MQDTILVVPPYHYCIEEDLNTVPLEDCWYARPQLFFTCILCPKDGRLPKNKPTKLLLMTSSTPWFFFSTFEELVLPFKGGTWRMLK